MSRNRLALLVCTSVAFSLIASRVSADTGLPIVSANDNRLPAGNLESGVLTLHLEIREGIWHPGASSGAPIGPEIPSTIDSYFFAEEGRAPQNPGPLIRVSQGTDVHISVHNMSPVAVKVHGLITHPVANEDENVMQLAPGETKEARFVAGAPGSYMYWAATVSGTGDTARSRGPSTMETRLNRDGPMSGGFIVDNPAGSTADRIFIIQIWTKNPLTPNFQGVLTINGKSWPYTERLDARLGEPQHWRVLNATPIPHPMHLHGFYFEVEGVGDGNTEHYYSAGERRMVVTESVPAGSSFDMTWVPERVGNWIFHCHILDHMTAYVSPVVYGPQGPPRRDADLAHQSYGHDKMMGMAKLVLGITVTDPGARLVPAKAVTPEVGAARHLIVRERKGNVYTPPGPGFYLDGVSQKVEAVGPPLVVTQGVRTAITVSNELTEPTAIHWHGIEIESYYDGVPGWTGTSNHTTPIIPPGGSFVAYMTPPRAGTFIYHTHWHDVAQLTGGMYGALLVLPPSQKFDPATDKVFVLGRCGPNEFHDPLMLNGSPQPGVMFLLSQRKYRFRFVNMTPNDSPLDLSMDLKGKPIQWRAIAKDGADLPSQQAVVEDATGPLSVGETRDFEFEGKVPGEYVLRFLSPFGSEVSQVIMVVPPGLPISAYAIQP